MSIVLAPLPLAEPLLAELLLGELLLLLLPLLQAAAAKAMVAKAAIAVVRLIAFLSLMWVVQLLRSTLTGRFGPGTRAAAQG